MITIDGSAGEGGGQIEPTVRYHRPMHTKDPKNRSNATRRALACVPLLPLALLRCGASAGSDEAPPPLLVLGIDGATRTIMDPLMEQGRLPHFKRLRESGVYAALQTREPTISPIIWTSIATGKVPEKHGIHGFTAPIPGTEKTTRLSVPEARRELRLRIRGLAPAGIERQRGKIIVGGAAVADLELTAEPIAHELVLTPKASITEVSIQWSESVRSEMRSPFWVTALLQVKLSVDGGQELDLGPEDGLEGLYERRIEHAGEGWLRAGGPQRIVTVSSNMRRVKALWNILSERKRRVLVAGFWVTWPVEPVNGVMLSSYTSARYGRSKKGTYLKDFPRQTYPESLASELGPVLDEAIEQARRHAEDVAKRFGSLLQPIPASELRPVNRLLTGDAPQAPTQKPIPELADQIVWIRSSDTFYALASARLWPRDRPDLAIVYLGEVDVVSHDWWDREKELTRGVIADAYERADAALGKLLQAMGPDAERANVVVVSDHGFAFDRHGVFEHQFSHPPGILLMAGPGIRRGADPLDPGILDVPPTLLALLGLPAARDMDGRVLSEILAEPAPEPIASYETGPPKPPELPIPSPIDEKVKEQLRALGYLE